MMNRNIALLALPGLLLLSLAGSPALAKDKAEWRSWPLGQRLSIGVAGYRPSLTTKASLNAGPIQGTIDFESDLGLQDRDSVPLAKLRWRFFKRHSLRVDYFQLNRSSFAGGDPDLQICIPPEDAPGSCVDLVGASIGAFIDTEVINLGYDYSIIFNEKMNWSLGLGLSAQNFTLGIAGNIDENPPLDPPVAARAETKFTAPLPTLATTFNYAFTDKWILDLALNWLEVDIDLDSDGKFNGRILALDAGIRWQTWKNFGFEAGYTMFDMDMKIDDGQEIGGEIEYRYKGPRLGLNWYF